MPEIDPSLLFSIAIILVCFASRFIGLLPTLVILILLWLIVVLFHLIYPNDSNIKIGLIISFLVFSITVNDLIINVPMIGIVLDVIKLILVVYLEQKYYPIHELHRTVLITNVILLIPFKYSLVLEIQGFLIVAFNHLEPNGIRYYMENDELKMVYHRYAWLLSVGYSPIYILSAIGFFIYLMYSKEVVPDNLDTLEKSPIPQPKRISAFQKVVSSDDVYNLS